MTIYRRSFDPVLAKTTSRLFPSEIEDDPWVVFHGTSSINAERIEAEGFLPQRRVIPVGVLQSVVDVYKAIKWAGRNTGGYVNLRTYSVEHDHRDGRDSPVFFAEASLRAALYATREFAGGEKSRALRFAMEDLEGYLARPEVRDQHKQEMERTYEDLVRRDAHQSMLDLYRPVTVDLAWLSCQLDNLRPVTEIALQAPGRHRHGVVYALRLTKADLPGLFWHPSHGIEARLPIGCSRIVEKVEVPPDYDAPLLRAGDEGLDRKFDLGLFAALSLPRDQSDAAR